MKAQTANLVGIPIVIFLLMITWLLVYKFSYLLCSNKKAAYFVATISEIMIFLFMALAFAASW